MNIGIIGCGSISSQYMIGLNKSEKDLNVVACADQDIEKSKSFANEYKIESLSVEDLLLNSEIDIVVNLTPPSSHFDISYKCLKSGKHVFSEKPVALNIDQGKELLNQMNTNNLYLYSAPDTFLGPAFIKAKELVLSEKIGEIIGGSVSFATHGVEGWHPNPNFYYKKGGGPLYDMGPYYLTALIKILGPVVEVISYSQKTFSNRKVENPNVEYSNIEVDVDTHYIALLKFQTGVVVDFQVSFDIWKPYDPKLEFYGTVSSIKFADPNNYDGDISIFNKEKYQWENVYSPPDKNNEYYRGLGVIQMVQDISKNSVNKEDLYLPFHVLEVMSAIDTYDQNGKWVKIEQQF